MPKFVLYLLGEKGYQVLKAVLSAGYQNQVNLVVVGRDKGVQQDFSEEIIGLCEKWGLEHSTRLATYEVLKNPEACFALAAGWRWLIKDAFRQIIVFHDSLLPKYRGFNPLVTALLNFDREIGVTAIIADKDYDRGDIVESRSIKIEYPVRIRTVVNEISALYFDLAKSIFIKLQRNDCLKGGAQCEFDASYSVWRDEDDYRIDWTQSAESIVHFINCISFPYKGASTTLNGRIIRILEAEVEPDVVIVNRNAGKVVFNRGGNPIVICGAGLLKIKVAVYDDGCSALPFENFRARLK